MAGVDAGHEWDQLLREDGSLLIPEGMGIWRTRLRFVVGQSFAANIVSLLDSPTWTLDDYDTYQAEVEITTAGLSVLNTTSVTDVVVNAAVQHVLPFLSWGAALTHATTYHHLPLSPKAVDSRAVGPYGGGYANNPIAGVLNAPWRLQLVRGAPRRSGRVWWPGLPMDYCDLEAMTLKEGFPDLLTVSGKRFHNYLTDNGLAWVVMPREPGNQLYLWVVGGVKVYNGLRTYRRRRARREQSLSSSYGIPDPGSAALQIEKLIDLFTS